MSAAVNAIDNAIAANERALATAKSDVASGRRYLDGAERTLAIVEAVLAELRKF